MIALWTASKGVFGGFLNAIHFKPQRHTRRLGLVADLKKDWTA
jgi:hypothetical protein